MTKRGTDPLIYYHRAKGADAILRDGFRNGEGTYLTDRMRRGVWLSDQPLSAMEGAGGSHTIEVDIPEDLSDFEWVEEGKPYREWLVPAELVNRYPRRLVED